MRPLVLFVASMALSTLAVHGVEVGTAEASTVVAMTLPDLVDKSDLVFVGIPKSRVSRWEGGRILTYTTVAVDQAIGGNVKAGGTVVVRTYGGVVDGIGQITHGEAVLKPGTPMLLFLRPLPPGTKPSEPSVAVTGMAQGALPIVVGTDKVARVVPDVSQLALVQKPTEKLPPASVAVANKPLTDTVTSVRALWASKDAKK